jgi:hypothetical protein
LGSHNKTLENCGAGKERTTPRSETPISVATLVNPVTGGLAVLGKRTSEVGHR